MSTSTLNFNVVESAYVDIDSIYNDFQTDYLESTISNPDLRVKYNLSHKEFWDLTREIKDNLGLKKRPSVSYPKYYYKVKRGYIIKKRYGLDDVYIGWVKTEELAIQMVELCKKALWDVDVCRDIVRSYHGKAI